MESKFNAMFLTRNPDTGLYEKIPAAVAPESLLAFNEKGCVLIRSSFDPVGVYKFPELEERVAT